MPIDQQTLFERLLGEQEEKRPGYKSSLGSGATSQELDALIREKPAWRNLKQIYKFVDGTPRDILDQRLMDFIPGYRLLRFAEVRHGAVWNGEDIVPLLCNYSDDYIGFRAQGTDLWRLNHDDDTPYRIYDSIDICLETILECFQTGAYFVDTEGYLDLKQTEVLRISALHNPHCNYWQ